MKSAKAITKKATEYKADDVRPSSDRWITFSNALTRAGHGLTLTEKRIVATTVSKLDSFKALKPGAVLVTRLTASEYSETFAVSMEAAYFQLQTGSKNLYNRSITFFEQQHKRKGKDVKPTFVKMRWVGQIKYHDGEGWVELHWWPELLPHLTGLKRQFTSYQLKQTVALRSVYSWRLLELLTRFGSTGRAEYSVEDFCASMDTPPSLDDFAQLKRRVVEPAVKELREKDGWLIDWDTVKAGRKVKTIRFRFKKNPQTDLFAPSSKEE
ncbi:MAG: replication initiation protein [Methyloglobulus sp.]|nr:replication initiation protein [Methyloglobulus sp.]